MKEKMHNVSGYPTLVLSHITTVGKRTEQISRVIISYIEYPILNTLQSGDD
jgi:hypothetical protein